ncbi:hypothetical protein MUP77_09170 [Candidatus Bathyarchaeota archaeon]|nr:hypothetical protein [Candidatus Bathyarchaeota archaeon]
MNKLNHAESGFYNDLATTDDLNDVDNEKMMNIIQGVNSANLKVPKSEKLSKLHYELIMLEKS